MRRLLFRFGGLRGVAFPSGLSSLETIGKRSALYFSCCSFPLAERASLFLLLFGGYSSTEMLLSSGRLFFMPLAGFCEVYIAPDPGTGRTGFPVDTPYLVLHVSVLYLYGMRIFLRYLSRDPSLVLLAEIRQS